MDLSKLKIEIYDFLGLILPGLVAICEIWIAATGWTAFAKTIGNLSGTWFTLLLLLSFGLGHLIQELADVVIKRLKGSRYFKQSRDEFWPSEDAKLVKAAIARDLGTEVTSVDAAFDYCLSKIGERFPKRDAFMATSDLCRSFVVLAGIGIAPTVRLVLDKGKPIFGALSFGLAILSVLVLVAYLSWSRMQRFRELSEVTVFRVYLASIPGSRLKAHGGTTEEA